VERNNAEIVLTLGDGLVREIEVTAVRLRFAGKRGLQVVVRFVPLSDFMAELLRWMLDAPRAPAPFPSAPKRTVRAATGRLERGCVSNQL
jgi:hypothetical protein